MATTTERTDRICELRDDDAVQGRAVEMIAVLPWLQAGIQLNFPMDDAAVKSVCRFLNAPVTDHMLERWVSHNDLPDGKWTALDVFSLLCWLNAPVGPRG